MKQQIIRLGAQLKAIWDQIGMGQKVTLVLAALVLLVGIAGVGVWSARTDYSLLYGRLEDAEASKVVAVLDELKIQYRFEGGQIHVPSDKVHFLRMKLIERGLPRGEGVGYELFDRSNFGISDFLQRANYVRAIQTELARSIVLMDGVESARVFVVIPENRLLLDVQKKPTASVLVRAKGTGPLSQATVQAIRYLVANSVEGLQATQVAVMDQRGNTLVVESDSDAMGGLTANQLNVRRQYEQHLAKSAESMLDKVLGPGQAVVRVAAEISFESGKKEDEKYDPEGQVTLKEESKDRKVDTANTAATNGGVPGVQTNTANDSNSGNEKAAPSNTSKTSEKNTTKTYGVSRVSSTVVQPPGTIRRLSAAVFINAKTEGEGAAKKAVARTPEELEKLKRLVQSSIGIHSSGEGLRRDELTLEEMPFNETYATELTQQINKEERNQMIMGIVRSLGYPALALGMLFLFFNLLKKTSAENIPLGIPAEELAELEEAANGRAGKSNRKPEVVTVGVLNKLLKENPENMTMALRNWMERNKTAE